ncbi:MAG: hypothetical protein OIN66_09110 [Candidatus Methanoperedens sp.]|nr:hypothetical protein [Candidatus Methanoperedens sp.]
MRIIIALMVFMILMINAVAAGENSGRAKPDGIFYPLKIWMEKLSLNFIFDQMEELNGIIKKDTDNATENMRARIKERVENHTNRTKALKSQGRISVIQQSIIEAGGSRIAVSSVNGNVSVHTEGGNATVTRDGDNVTVISVTNNSRQIVIVRSSQNNSRSSRVSVRSEAYAGD